MSAANSTDLISLLNSTDILYDTQATISPDTEDNWMTRLLFHWFYMSGHSLGILLSLFVIGLTLFSKKHINGDYKWFILNQAFACFLYDIYLILYYSVYEIGLGPKELSENIQNPPLWFELYNQFLFVLNPIAVGADMNALLATVFNRWMAVALSNHYSTFMTPRLTFFICLLCYLLPLLFDFRLYVLLSFSVTLSTAIIYASILLPWLMSVIFSASIFHILLKHQRVVNNVANEQRLKESRTMLYSVFAQLAVHFFNKFTIFVQFFLFELDLVPYSMIGESWILTLFEKIYDINWILCTPCTCLVILITMGPYRKAALSFLSPITNCCKRFFLKYSSKMQNGLSVSQTRTPVINIQPRT